MQPLTAGQEVPASSAGSRSRTCRQQGAARAAARRRRRLRVLVKAPQPACAQFLNYIDSRACRGASARRASACPCVKGAGELGDRPEPPDRAQAPLAAPRSSSSISTSPSAANIGNALERRDREPVRGPGARPARCVEQDLRGSEAEVEPDLVGKRVSTQRPAAHSRGRPLQRHGPQRSFEIALLVGAGVRRSSCVFVIVPGRPGR